jgi:hypothetical protein
MRQTLYTFAIRVTWDNADGTLGIHKGRHGLYAPSLKAAHDRAIRHVEGLPCYADRAGQRVEGEVAVVETLPPGAKQPIPEPSLARYAPWAV